MDMNLSVRTISGSRGVLATAIKLLVGTKCFVFFFFFPFELNGSFQVTSYS